MYDMPHHGARDELAGARHRIPHITPDGFHSHGCPSCGYAAAAAAEGHTGIFFCLHEDCRKPFVQIPAHHVRTQDLGTSLLTVQTDARHRTLVVLRRRFVPSVAHPLQHMIPWINISVGTCRWVRQHQLDETVRSCLFCKERIKPDVRKLRTGVNPFLLETKLCASDSAACPLVERFFPPGLTARFPAQNKLVAFACPACQLAGIDRFAQLRQVLQCRRVTASLAKAALRSVSRQAL